jgi:murein DD-endopeptidase MepM/ murein hydrolase activator NlpD
LVKRTVNRFALVLILIIPRLPACTAQEFQAGSFSPSGSQGVSYSFPVIVRMENRDTSFRQYIGDVESNRRRLAGIRSNPSAVAEHLTIYQYTARQGDDLFSVAARCNIPYSALASLNRLDNPASLEEGRVLLLPSCPGIFIPGNPESDLEKLIGAARLERQESVELKITALGTGETFHFFPGADFTPTERAFFLNSGFRFPLRTFRLTSSYGVRENPVTGNITMHQGVDLAAPEGTEVFAAADGTVMEIGEDPVYGIYIIVSHRDRFTSLYGHLQRVETVLRAAVRSGTLIGRVGSTGQSTGPHLHFELRQDGRAVNPSGRLGQ